MYKTYVIYRCVKPSPFNNYKNRDALQSFAWDLYESAVMTCVELSKSYPEEKFLLVEESFSEKLSLEANNAIW